MGSRSGRSYSYGLKDQERSSRNSRESSRRVSDAVEIERLGESQGSVADDPRDLMSFRGSIETSASAIDIEAASFSSLNILEDLKNGDMQMQMKVSKAPSKKVREVAIEMFKLLKQHGLLSEAQKAFEHLHDVSTDKDYNGPNILKHKRDEEQVFGVQHMLKHGVVNFLRDLARLSPPIPHQVLRFRGISYSVEMQEEVHEFETFGNKLMGCFLGPFKSLFTKKKRSSSYEVLKDVHGYAMPGSMTLLLGPPGSGKSSLLKVLAGRAHIEKYVKLEGTVKYNERDVSEVLRTRLIAYINGQANCHLPFLNVRETLEFAEDCTQLGLRPENFPPHMRKIFAYALVEGEDPYLEYILRVLGLKNIEHETVGKSRKDGIDDSERNRLTTAEIAMGTHAVMIYDQPHIGQDPLATYDLVHTLRAVNRIQQSSAVISLVQISAEVFDIFDRVILLGEGQILYQGPRQDALHYFSQLGYNKPAHVDPGDFLENIAAGEGGQYLEPSCLPHTNSELIALYQNSDLYKDVLRIVTSEKVLHTFWVESEADIELSVHNSPTSMTISNEPQLQVARLGSRLDDARGIESTARLNVGDKVTAISKPAGGMHYIDVGDLNVAGTDHHHASHNIISLLQNASGHVIRLQVERQRVEESEEDRTGHEKFDQEYVQGWWQSTQSLIRRQWNVTRRLKTLILLRCMQVIVLGFFGGTIFYHLAGRIDSLKMNSIRGMGFVSSMTVLLINLVQQPLHMLQRPVFYKQRAQRFYRASSYLVAEAAVSLPQSIVEAFLYSMGAYFLASLSRTWAHYLEYLLLLCLVAYLGSSLVRFTSSVAPLLEAANALAGALVAIFLLFSGFVIYPHNVPPYWKWMLYANPLHWAILIYGLIQLGENYKEPCSDFTKTLQFCHVYPGMTVGNAFLKFYGLKTERHLVWVGYAIIIIWILLFNLFSYLALKNIQYMEVIPSLPRQKNKAHVYSDLDEEKLDVSDSFSRELNCNINVIRDNNAKTTQCEYQKALDEEAATKPENGTSVLPAADKNPKLTPFAKSFLRRHHDSNFDEFVHEKNGTNSIVARIPKIKPITLSFLDIGLIVRDPKSERDKVLLHGVSGYAKPGSMVALVGSSTVGATPLLKCLAGRVSHGTVEGDIFVNGVKQSAKILSRISGYAEQLDAHQPYLTVRESLEFSSNLRLREPASNNQRLFLVDLILELMGLSEVSNHLVGELRYSTGRTYELFKKLTIAVELAANPSILFLDNPTSNLDSVGVRNVMYAMRAVARIGRTVFSTVRHPSASMLSAFDKVLILNDAGEQVYFGPLGWNCSKFVEYFLCVPNVRRYDREQNPMTYVLDILGTGIKLRTPTLIQDYNKLYLESQLGRRNAAEIMKLCSSKHGEDDSLVMSNQSGYAASYQKQARMVFLRTQRFLYRNVHYTFGRLAASIALGLLLGSVYIQIHWSSTISMTSRSLFIYIQVLLIGVMNANNVIPQLGSDRLAYFREKRAHMYAPIFYPISWALGEIPYLILITLIFVAIGNGMAGIGTDTIAHFLEYWFGLFLFTLAMTYFGIFLTIATPVPMLAAFAMSICLSIWITGSGVVIPKLRIHFYAWLYWCNPFQYAINALTSISFYCNTKSDICVACPAGQPCPACPCKQLEDLGYTFVWNRLKYVRSLNHGRIALDFVALGGLSTVLAILCVLSFVFFKHNSKPSS